MGPDERTKELSETVVEVCGKVEGKVGGTSRAKHSLWSPRNTMHNAHSAGHNATCNGKVTLRHNAQCAGHRGDV